MGDGYLMQCVDNLESLGYVLSLNGGSVKIRYAGRGSPGNNIAPFLDEIKNRKIEVIAYLQSRTHARDEKEMQDTIRMAYMGELKKPVLLAPNAEWQGIWQGNAWLVPDEASKTRIKAKHPGSLVVLPGEFFNLCQTVDENGQGARAVFEAFSMFGGQLYLGIDAVEQTPNDPGADISPEDSALWLPLLEKARAIDMDFAARLLYIRGAGAKLVPDERIGYRIQPIIDPSGVSGWTSLKQYEAERWCLDPYKTQLVEVLKALDRKAG
jgi:hypothetical protein